MLERPGGYAGAESVEMIWYSSWEPTADGRIKPDLVASGFPGWVPSSNAGYYDYEEGQYGGTSFAAPAVAGSLALLQEMHERLSGTNGIPLLASTYKGLAIHTADEAGGAPGPDYRFGWGLMNTHAAASLMVSNAAWNSSPFIKEITLPEGEVSFFSFNADTNQLLRVTICWSDPPNSTLINDIDPRVVDPLGQTNYPWVLNPVYPLQAATRNDNFRDNVEQVVVDNTVTGSYTVVVCHKGDLEADAQEISIVLGGNIPENFVPVNPIDPLFRFSINTNGYPQFEWIGMLGDVYEILATPNLLYLPWAEVPDSPISIITTNTVWIDPAVTTNSVRFYRINQTE